MNRPDISTQDMMRAIERSGYLLESEITKALAEQKYFVESNISFLDPLSGKSREIDLVAEYDGSSQKTIDNKTVARINFVFEIKNNLYPFVLLTKMEFSPNTIEMDELKEIITVPEGIAYDSFDGFYSELIYNQDTIYTQYCSFQHKKGQKKELMALHPDNLHSGFDKIVQYCDERISIFSNISYNYEYFRHFLYMPILLINDNLYELEIANGNKTKLRKVKSSKLVYNYHLKDESKSSIIFVMTKEGLNEFLPKMRALEEKLIDKMIKLKM